MGSVSYILISQQEALRKQMDIIANNIANVSTPGFKSGNIAFKEYLSKPADGDPTSYVQFSGTALDLTQGPISHTGADFDFAINGQGYFSIGAATGTQYTRNGHFRLDNNGQIVNDNGDPLLSESGAPIIIPSAAQKITVMKEGTIYADNAIIGKIGLVNFPYPQKLASESGGIFKVVPDTDNRPTKVTKVELIQGSLEEANVQGVVEMTKMMQVARSYESAQKIIDKEDDRIRQAIRRLSQNQ